MFPKCVKDHGTADSKTANSAQRHKLRCDRAQPYIVSRQCAQCKYYSQHIQPNRRMHNIAAGAIVKPELKQNRSQPDCRDHHDGKRAKKRPAIRVEHNQSQQAAKHSRGKNRPATRLPAIVRHRFGRGIEFGQIASDETHCSHIWRCLRVAGNSP